MSSLKELEPYVDKALDVLLSRLSEVDTRQINMSRWAQLFAFGKGHSTSWPSQLLFDPV